VSGTFCHPCLRPVTFYIKRLLRPRQALVVSGPRVRAFCGHCLHTSDSLRL